MLIESLEIYRVRMPLIYPFRTAFADAESIDTVLVKMSSQGMVGWGEATPWGSPLYSSEWAAGVYGLVREWLGPKILGKQIETADALQDELGCFKGNQFAKASLDLAWWDLQAQLSGQPLWKLLGGSSDTVDVGADFGVMETIPLLLKTIEDAFASGFKRIKLKFRPGWDLEMVRAVRRAFPEGVFHVDCNSAYQLSDASIFQELDEYNLAMVEQPLGHDDLLDHAKLQQMIKTPICLDESINSVKRAVQAMEIDACRWINIKPGRIGGLTPARQIISEAERRSVPCWVGGMLESAVGASHCLALSSLSNIHYPADLFPSNRFYKKDLGQPEIELSGPSQITAQPGPGIGCTPNFDLLQELSLEHHQIDNN